MNKLFLTDEVIVRGPDYWGRESWIKFSHHPGSKPGWWWDTGEALVPIDIRIAETKTRRVILRHGRHTLNIWEHVGALRFTGLDSVVVACESFPSVGIFSGCWTPYDGCSALFWRALQSAVSESEEKVVWRRVCREGHFIYPGAYHRQTMIRPPVGDEVLRISATTDYPGLGRQTTEVDYPANRNVLDLAMETKSQGWPLWAYRPGRWLEKREWLPVRPRPSQMTWPQVVGTSKARVMFNHHRVLDIFGGLSLVWHDALPSCRTESIMSGHLGDIMAIRKLFI